MAAMATNFSCGVSLIIVKGKRTLLMISSQNVSESSELPLAKLLLTCEQNGYQRVTYEGFSVDEHTKSWKACNPFSLVPSSLDG
jgi:hypothetical protein